MSPAQIQKEREKLARQYAKGLRGLAGYLRSIAKDAAQPMYSKRVVSDEFSTLYDSIRSATLKLANVVVPKTPQGFADARALIGDIIAQAFSPLTAEKEKRKEKNSRKKQP
jgi:hypothetical protein